MLIYAGICCRVEMLPGWVLLINNLTEEDSGSYSCSSSTVDGFWVMSENDVNVTVDPSGEHAWAHCAFLLLAFPRG